MCNLGRHDHPEDMPTLAQAAPVEVIAPALSRLELGEFHGNPDMEPLPPGGDLLPDHKLRMPDGARRWWGD